MHEVTAVEIRDGKVRVVCECGWKSKWGDDDHGETAQREEHAKHAVAPAKRTRKS